MAYPNIVLDSPVEVQSAIVASELRVIHVAENPDEKFVKVFVATPTSNVWIEIMNEENYDPEWTDETVELAVKSWADENFKKV